MRVNERRRDLGMSFGQLTRAMVDAEKPLLDGQGVQMWDYLVLAGLESGPAPTQLQLADAIRRDKTRLIPILDRLEARGLVHRQPDPSDRRNRVVELTDSERALLGSCRQAIRAMEAELLRVLEPSERAIFLTALEKLVRAAATRPEIGTSNSTAKSRLLVSATTFCSE
jgi:DNA-binding MarR family transcriptional regulator